MSKQNIVIVEKQGIYKNGSTRIYLKDNIEKQNIDFAKQNTNILIELCKKYSKLFDLDKSDLTLGFIFENGKCSKIEYSFIIVPFIQAVPYYHCGSVENIFEILDVFRDDLNFAQISYVDDIKNKPRFIIINKIEMITILNLILNYCKYSSSNVINKNLKILCDTSGGIGDYFENGCVNTKNEYVVDIKKIISTQKIDSNYKKESSIYESIALLNLASAINIYDGYLSLFFKCYYHNKICRVSYNGTMNEFFNDLFLCEGKFYLKTK